MENENVNSLSKEELKKWFTFENKSGYKSTEKWLSKHQPILYNLIIINCNEDGLVFNAKIWLYINNFKESPKCPLCGNKCNFSGKLSNGFGKYCSKECSFKTIREFNEENKKNIKSTFHDSIYENNLSGLKSTDFYVKKSYPKEYDEIISYPININNKISWSEKLYNYIHHLEKIPTCLNCDNKVKFISLKDGYRKYCSKKCSGIHNSKIVKETNIRKYGYDNIFKVPKIKEKIKQTNLIRYGVEFASQNKEIANKAQNTMIERYGEIWLKHTPTYNANSIIYLDILAKKLGLHVQHALNGGEKKFVRYWIDGYIEKYNICIEWDEKHHNLKKFKEKDNIKEKYLIETHDCHIIRINEKEFLNNIEENILLISHQINNIISLI